MDPKPRTIGLIGGTGQMGRMFQRLFAEAGYRVLVAGRRTELTPEALVAAADVVIVTVPIARTVETLRRIAPAVRPGQLLSDFTSVKRAPVAAMLETPASVIGCHPIFGPMADPAGQSAVLCPARPGPYLPWYRDLLGGLGMRVREMTPEAHDEAMALVQALTHFVHVAFARTLRARQAPPEDLLEIASPVYRAFFAMQSRILGGDPSLYSDIQLYNEAAPEVARAFLDEARALLEPVAAGDDEGYRARFREAADYLGAGLPRARRESDLLVEQMRRHLAPSGEAGEPG